MQATLALVGLVLAMESSARASSTLAVSPENPRQLQNLSVRFTALLNGKALKAPVQWSSSNPTVAIISPSGEATLLSPGTSTISAKLGAGSQQASTVLKVTTAAPPVFSAQPTDTNVSAVINAGSGVQVQLLDNLGSPLPGQQITMSVGANPPVLATPSYGSGTLSGTLTQTTNSSGIATFADLKIDWLGNGYTLIAGANPISGPVSGTSAEFNELRVGDACLGPDTPACQGSCPDADGDGLNDAWEIAGGVDLNGDGKIDVQHDLLLPAADPAKPDIYVRYDWMDYGTLDYACSVDSDCPQNGNSAFGTATCVGPKIASSSLPGSCVQACSTDADCHALAIPGNGGDSHAVDRCVSNVCRHTHDPELLTPGAIDAVVDRFAARGFNLHVARGQALPHSHLLSLRTLDQMTDGCEGGSVSLGTAGIGQYAESFFDLKAKSFDQRQRSAYHYVIFGHYSGCDSFEHCAADGHTGACPVILAPNACTTAVFGQSGYSEINGNDFIVSLGRNINDFEGFLNNKPPGNLTIGQLMTGGTFMHELGHNLGLRHGGGASSGPDPNSCVPPDCEDGCTIPAAPNFKPNFLSVMNYRYQFSGIQSASAPGEFVPADSRLDYSTQVLPSVPVSDAIAGLLDETDLDEAPAHGLTSGNADLFSFANARCESHLWPTHAAVDWDGSGVAGDNSAVMADLNPEENPAGTCGAPFERHRGHVDWGPAPGQSIFRYGFQCTQYFADPPSALGAVASKAKPQTSTSILTPPIANGETIRGGELTAEQARAAHVLYPTAGARITIRPGCGASAKPVAPGQQGTFTVALYGASDLDVAKVNISSLRFHGASALNTSFADLDGDGRPDLLVTFDMSQVVLHANATTARLTGWMQNSQLFVASAPVTIVNDMSTQPAECRN
jgi:hypothetical protein